MWLLIYIYILFCFIVFMIALIFFFYHIGFPIDFECPLKVSDVITLFETFIDVAECEKGEKTT